MVSAIVKNSLGRTCMQSLRSGRGNQEKEGEIEARGEEKGENGREYRDGINQ